MMSEEIKYLFKMALFGWLFILIAVGIPIGVTFLIYLAIEALK